MNISYIKNTKSTSSINNPTKSVGEAKLEPKNEDKNTVNSKKTSANDKCDIICLTVSLDSFSLSQR